MYQERDAAGTDELALDTPRLRVTRATSADEDRLQRCFEESPGYFRLTERRAPRSDEARHLLDEADADPQRRVYVIAPRDDSSGDAIGVLDLHLDYPEPGTVHVALLLFRERWRDRGLGREVCAALEEAAAAAGFDTLRLSVVDENRRAKAFWEAVGFWEVGRLDRGVAVYEKTLASRSAAPR